MSKKALFLTAIILVFSACELQAAVNHSTWVGGEQGDWGQAGNWDPARVPDNSSWRTFVVTIDSDSIGVDEIEVYLQQDRAIDRLDCYGEVGIETSTPSRVVLTLSDVDGLINHGELEISGHAQQLEVRGNVTNTKEATLGLCGVEIHGDLCNLADATIEVESENDIHKGGLQNDGTITIIHASDLLCDQQVVNNGLINIHSGEFGIDGILDNNSTGVIKGFGVFYAKQLLQNEGYIYAYGGSLTVLSEGSITNTGILANKALSTLHIKPAVDMNNLGTIEVNAGGGVAFDCNMVNEPNAVIKLLGGTIAAKTITQSAGAIFEGFGGITGNIMINPNGLIELTGPTNIVGDVTVEHNAVLEISDGQTLIVGYTTNNGEIRVVNGNVIFQGGYSGSGIVQKE